MDHIAAPAWSGAYSFGPGLFAIGVGFAVWSFLMYRRGGPLVDRSRAAGGRLTHVQWVTMLALISLFAFVGGVGVLVLAPLAAAETLGVITAAMTVVYTVMIVRGRTRAPGS